MAVPGNEQPNPSPNADAAKPAPSSAVDATKYVGTPAVGTSRAAASAGLSSAGPSNTEIDHEAREEARRLGFTQFEMSSGLNDSAKFIGALGQLVLQTLDQAVHSYNVIHTDDEQPATPELLAAAGD